MKIDFSQALKKDFDGNNATTPDGAVMTLGRACVEVLMANFNDEQDLGGEEKVKRYDLASAIYAAVQPLDLTVEYVAMLKKLIAKGYGPIIVGQAWKMLDG